MKTADQTRVRFELFDPPQEYSLGRVKTAIEESQEAGLTDNASMVFARVDVSGQWIYHTHLRPEYDEDQQILFWVIDE